jgi:hypothetical protein
LAYILSHAVGFLMDLNGFVTLLLEGNGFLLVNVQVPQLGHLKGVDGIHDFVGSH